MTHVAEPVLKIDGEGTDPATDMDFVSNGPIVAAEDDVASSRGPVPTLRYSKADLVALSQLEVCKTQPEALDSSILKYFCRIPPYSAAFCLFRTSCHMHTRLSPHSARTPLPLCLLFLSTAHSQATHDLWVKGLFPQSCE